MKILSIPILALMLLCQHFSQAQTAVAPQGAGTVGNPYRIATLENLYWLSQNSAQWASTKYFIQTADIDASATSTWFPNGSGGYYGFPCIGGFSQAVGNQVTGSFAGNYDGQGYSISNLYINRGPDYVALWGRGNNAIIRNLTLLNPTVLVSGGTSSNFQGCAIFMSSGSATIDNIHISGGSLTNTSYFGYCGAMFGRVFSITASNSSTSASVNVNCVTGSYVGGFIGYPSSGTCTFNNCSATGNVTANGNYVGGFVGIMSATSTFNSCWSTGNVNAAGNAGGFTGYLYGASFNNCYARGNVSGANSGGFSGYSDSQPCTLTNCYATGTVSSATNSGGFGKDRGVHTYNNCFFDNQTTGKSNAFGTGVNTGVTAATTSQMTSASTFTNAGWDFIGETTNGTNDFWFTNGSHNGGYPALAGNIREWTGTINNSWSNPSNWMFGILPTASSIIRLSNGAPNLPAVSSDITVDRFSFNGTNYLLDLGPYNLICNQVLGFNANRYVKTSGTGVLRLSIANTRLGTFPVGNSAFNPAYITNNTGSTDNFSIRVLDEVYKNGTSGPVSTQNRVRRTWDISKTNPNAGSGINIELNWNPGEVEGTISPAALFHYAGSWTRQTGTTSATSTSLTYTGYTGSFSPFAVAEFTSTLPANELIFRAKPSGTTAILEWTTSSETNTKNFIVEHSTNASNWTEIGKINAQGNSNSLSSYTFAHLQAPAGLNHYRLKLTDNDGGFAYSRVVAISFSGKQNIEIYPNPATSFIVIEGAKDGQYQLLNVTGNTTKQGVLTSNNQTLDLSGLPAGIYHLRINMGGEWSARKLVISK
jgi:hypothetical protein